MEMQQYIASVVYSTATYYINHTFTSVAIHVHTSTLAHAGETGAYGCSNA